MVGRKLNNRSAAVADPPESRSAAPAPDSHTAPSWALPSDQYGTAQYSGESWALPAEPPPPATVVHRPAQPRPAADPPEAPEEPEAKVRDRSPDGHLYPAAELKRKMDEQVQRLVDDYINERSLGEALHAAGLIMEEFPEMQHHLVKRILSYSLDKSERDRESFAKLITSLCIRGDISSENLREGLTSLLLIIDELALDVPDISLHVGYFLAIVLMDHCLTDDILDEVLAVTAASELGVEVVTCTRGFVSTELPLSVEQLKQNVTQILEEFMANGDCAEAVDYVHDLHAPHFHHEVVKRTITLSLNSKKRECELSSQLLKALHEGSVMATDQLEDGIIRLLFRLHDLVLDTPDAPNLLALFVQRLISDGVLPNNFAVMRVPPSLVVPGTLGGEFVSKLTFLLESDQRSKASKRSKDPKDWQTASTKTIDEIKGQFDTILHEFFVTGDVVECLQAVKQLEAPHYIHEMVKEAITLSMDLKDKGQQLLMALLRHGCETGQLSPFQVASGLDRVLERIPDLAVDVPDAPRLYAQLLYQVFEESWVPSDYLAEFLNRKAQHQPVDPAEQAVFKHLETILIKKKGHSV